MAQMPMLFGARNAAHSAGLMAGGFDRMAEAAE